MNRFEAEIDAIKASIEDRVKKFNSSEEAKKLPLTRENFLHNQSNFIAEYKQQKLQAEKTHTFFAYAGFFIALIVVEVIIYMKYFH